MKELIKFPLESGGFVFVEMEGGEAERSGLVKAGRGLPDEAAQSFEAAINGLSPIASSIVSKLINISHPPDEARQPAHVGPSDRGAGVWAGWQQEGERRANEDHGKVY